MAKWAEIKCPRCEELEAGRDALAEENERLRGNVQTMIHAFFAAREGELSAAMHLCVAEVIAATPPPCNDGE